jgi:hypothetical protein
MSLFTVLKTNGKLYWLQTNDGASDLIVRYPSGDSSPFPPLRVQRPFHGYEEEAESTSEIHQLSIVCRFTYELDSFLTGILLVD